VTLVNAMIRPSVLVCFLALGFAYRLHSQAPMFTPAPGSPVEVGPGSGTVILIDVNGDGHLDLVTRHLLTRLVKFLLGDGTGEFASARDSIVFEYAPGDITLGDVNNDSILDLVATRSDRDIVDVFLGDGKGHYTRVAGSPITASTAIDPYNKRTLRLADLNEDGNLDIVTANGRRRNTFVTLLGDGRGGFTPGPIVKLDQGRDGYSFAFSDVDGDGHLDVISASSLAYPDSGVGRVVLQKGDGRGGFTEAFGSPLSVANGPAAVAVADLNGDQRPDILISHTSGLLTLLLNEGGAGFSTPVTAYDLGTQAFAPIVVDINRDRNPDIVAATVNSVTVLLGDGQRFAPAPGTPFRAGPGAYYLTVGDLNHDRQLDIVASSFEGDGVTVLLGR
jgi:hypothetical protein